MNNKSLDIIIPTCNEESFLPHLLSSLEQAEKKVKDTFSVKVIIADSGSKDNTEAIAIKHKIEFVKCKIKGRGYQIREAYTKSSGALVLVLHADHVVNQDALLLLTQKLEKSPEFKWGILGHCYEEKNFKMSLVRIANFFRFKFKKIAFGDQGMFFNREMLDFLGGFPAQKLMEDVETSLILKDCPSTRIGTLLTSSSRRWKNQSYISYALLTKSILKNYIIDRAGGKKRLKAAENAWENYEIN